MFGLTRREARFGVVISATHLGQHCLMRLVPPLIPVLAVALDYPLWQLGLLISLFSLGSGIAQAPLGILSDRHNRLFILPTGIAVAGSAYVLFASALTLGTAVPDVAILGYSFEGGFLVMCFSMLVVGLGSAVVHPTGYPMITANISEENKGKVLGAFGSSAKVGDAAAPALVAVLILVLVWEQILAILGIAGILFATMLFYVLRSDEFETVPAGQSPETNDTADTAETATSIWEADRRTYMYPLFVIYIFFISKKFGSEGIKTFLPAFLVGVYAYSFDLFGISLAAESIANFYFSAVLLFAAAIQLSVGGLTDRFDPRFVLIGGVSIATFGFLSLAVLTLSPVFLLFVLLLLGGGIWGLAPARDALISEIAPAEREGRTFGYIWTAISLSATVMPVLIGYIMEEVGLRAGFLVLALGTAVAAIAISFLFLDQVYVADEKPAVGTGKAD